MATPDRPVPDGGSEAFVPDDELITGEAVALDLRPASFVLRGAGAAIDFAVIVIGFLGLVALFSSEALAFLVDPAALQAIVIAMLVVLTIGVPITVETLTHGKSLGRLAVGVRIVRDDGGAIGFRHAFIRALTGFFEVFMTFGGGAVVIGLLNARSKRLGDLLAGTYSQNERVPQITTAIHPVPPELSTWASTADVGRLPDRLARRISQFLRQSGTLLPTTRARLANELAGEASAFVSPLPDAHPEALLLAVIALRRDREAMALHLEAERMHQLDAVLGGLPRGFPDRT